MLSNYSPLDIAIFVFYGFILLVSGWFFNRQAKNGNDYFLGGQSMPVWAVAISVLATSQSAATFLGGPDQGYRNDLTYLTASIASIVAAIFVAKFLIPKFYQYRVYTVYGLLAQRYGMRTQHMAGAMYLVGRVFASGARLFMAAIAISMILFGDILASHVILSICLITLVGLLYTVYGGIRTVIFSDVLQAAVYIFAAVAVIVSLLYTIPADISEIFHALNGANSQSIDKLKLFDFSLDFSSKGVFSIWSILTGLVLLNIAAFGLDQDMTQRMLTCNNAKQGSKAMYMSVVMSLPVVLLFIVIGLLLFIYYREPALMQKEMGEPLPTFSGASITVFMYYVLTALPAGVKGLVTIGIVAAALSTLNSGLNSMASVIVQDFYKPWAKSRSRIEVTEKQTVFAGKIAMTIVAIALASMASLCFYWQQYSDAPLLQFALSVMVFSYSGLLGVYFSVVFTNRGNAYTVAAALIAGFAVPFCSQPYIMSLYLPEPWQFSLGFTWQLLLGTVLAFITCQLGKPNHVTQPASSRS